MLSRMHNRKGFTLIELMIVVVIIGILAALAIPRFMATSGKAKKSEAKTILKQLYQLERAYFQEHDAYVAGATTADLVATDLGFDDPGADARLALADAARDRNLSAGAPGQRGVHAPVQPHPPRPQRAGGGYERL